MAQQQGAVTYDRAIEYSFEVPDFFREMRDEIPNKRTSSMVLLFDETQSITQEAPQEEEEITEDQPRMRRMAFWMRMTSASRSDREDFGKIYVNRDEDRFTETREFMGRTFLLSDYLPTYAWKLTGEESEFLGYMVQKATAVMDTTHIEAWFTPEIPAPIGPGVFGGLPGLILVISVDDGRIVYSATGIKLGGLQEGLIQPPEEGRRVTSEEYEEIVEEKLEEMRGLRRMRRR